MKDKKENCVELNIYVECDKCHRPEKTSICPEDKHECDDDSSCVKINVFVDCEGKKHRYTI